MQNYRVYACQTFLMSSIHGAWDQFMHVALPGKVQEHSRINTLYKILKLWKDHMYLTCSISLADSWSSLAHEQGLAPFERPGC